LTDSAPTLRTQSTAINVEEFIKIRKTPFFVIPAEAGIKSNQVVLDPGVRRGDSLGDFLRSSERLIVSKI
jgi:hypothetical protein